MINLPVHTENITSEDAMQGARIYFIESSSIEKMGASSLRCDVMFNMNSFCEMTSEAVDRYLSNISFSRLYSSNRERQFMNHEIATLSSVLSRHVLRIWPTVEDYRKINREIKKLVFWASNDNDIKLPQIELKDLNGIFGMEMPAL